MVPLVVIVIREMLDTKIRGKKDLASLTIPFLGEIPVAFKKARGFDRFDKEETGNTEEENRGRGLRTATASTEAFRVLRAQPRVLRDVGGPSARIPPR